MTPGPPVVRGGEYTPVVKVSATPTSSTTPPLTVQFSSAGTEDPDGDRIAYAWDFDANGTVDSRQAFDAGQKASTSRRFAHS